MGFSHQEPLTSNPVVPTPLLPLSWYDITIIFSTQIIRYMYETSLAEDKRQLIGSYVIQQGLTHERLRDEIYVQLCNQTMGDPRRTDLQIDRAWQLLTNCLSVFPPSMQLTKYLLKYDLFLSIIVRCAFCQ